MFPEFSFRAVAAPAVGRYQQRGGVAMIINAHFIPPIPYALDCKLSRVFSDAHIDPTFINAHVVNAIGNRDAFRIRQEIISIDICWGARWQPVRTIVFVIPHKFPLFCIYRYDRLVFGKVFFYLPVDKLKLCIPVLMSFALISLAVRLQAEPFFFEFVPNYPMAGFNPVSYTHLRAHETDSSLVC